MSAVAATRRELALRNVAARRGRGIRILISLIVIAVAAVAAFANEATRALEASISTLALHGLLGYDAYAWRDQLIFRLGEDRFDVLALRITVECTSLVVIVPLLLFAVGILIITRVSITRWMISVLVAVAIVFSVNILRIVVIAYSLREFGHDGYGWSHTVIGTAIIAVGTVTAVITMLAIQSRPARRRRG